MSPSRSDSPRPTTPATVLVVDDEPMVLSTVQRLLDSLGFATVTAPTVAGALDAARAVRSGPDVILLDMTINDLDLPGFVRQVRQLNPNTRILLTSGSPPENPEQMVLDAGVDGFVQKPFLSATLDDQIRRLLEPHRSQPPPG